MLRFACAIGALSSVVIQLGHRCYSKATSGNVIAASRGNRMTRRQEFQRFRVRGREFSLEVSGECFYVSLPSTGDSIEITHILPHLGKETFPTEESCVRILFSLLKLQNEIWEG